MSHHTADTSGGGPEGDDEELDAADTAAQKRLIADFYSRVAASYDQVGPAVFSRFGELVVKVAGIYEGARVLVQRRSLLCPTITTVRSRVSG